MPYRRLPNTDSARLKALKIAIEKGTDLPPFKLAYSQSTFQKIRADLPGYENALSEHKNSYNIQLEKSKDHNKAMKKVRLYISHFIQVINMAILRGELPQNTRDFFQLEEDEKKLPSLNTDEDIILWAEKLLKGAQERRMKGLSPITNPTIAVVKVQYDKFSEAKLYQQGLKKRYLRAQKNLNARKDEADTNTQHLWNEVEDTFKELPEELRREKASEYGVVYVFRKNEIGNINLLKASHVSIG